MPTNSANDVAFIFRITLPRCAFTVISLMPSSPPTCLFSSPETTSAITSRSREVSDSKSVRNACIWLSRPSAASLRLIACRIAFGSTVGIEGFRQEFESSALHRFHGHRYIAITSEKDDRRCIPLGCDSLLQFETAEIGKRYIQDYAARYRASRTGKEFPRRFECLDFETFVAKEELQRFADRNVIVDYENSGRGSVRHGR